MVSSLVSGSSGSASSSGRGHHISFLDKKLHSHVASPHPCRQGKLTVLRGNPAMNLRPIQRGGRSTA